ncbi:hypothetical protein Desti_2213 [Desulfomonile tiedjei DSM 6799]|uniref:Uncharacterized protein n=1 Tax=Desulfomonile tiedjei (strain ATCC 49306 / DSM 6799 / DCB-1) TaxID=706587 RepID=I4C5R3_DESTA|nr:hypothetical protein Desti_2213 [Desulfomonile tiedjei DSM 6799]
MQTVPIRSATWEDRAYILEPLGMCCQRCTHAFIRRGRSVARLDNRSPFCAIIINNCATMSSIHDVVRWGLASNHKAISGDEE